MNERERIDELINAAYRVVTHPSVGAYRGPGYDKKVARPQMRRLLRALDPIINDARREEIRKRLHALDVADADLTAAIQQTEIEKADRARDLDARRHPFRGGDRLMGHGCMDCTGYQADAVHRAPDGTYLEAGS